MTTSHDQHCTNHDHAEVDCLTDLTTRDDVTTWRATGPLGRRVVIRADHTYLDADQLSGLIDHLTGLHKILVG